MSGLSSLTGGGGLSASSSAKSGDAKAGNVGISIGGITTTGTGSSNGVPSWVYLAAIALVAFYLMRRR
jgi:hypothetical protein